MPTSTLSHHKYFVFVVIGSGRQYFSYASGLYGFNLFYHHLYIVFTYYTFTHIFSTSQYVDFHSGFISFLFQAHHAFSSTLLSLTLVFTKFVYQSNFMYMQLRDARYIIFLWFTIVGVIKMSISPFFHNLHIALDLAVLDFVSNCISQAIQWSILINLIRSKWLIWAIWLA